MLKRWVDCYSRLLACLPQDFQDEFAEEMGQVFASRLGEARRGGRWAAFCTWIDELLALPGLWLLARQRGGRMSVMDVNHASDPDDSPASWVATLAAALPLVGFMASYFLAKGLYTLLASLHLSALFSFLWMDVLGIAVMPLVFYLVLLGGLLVAWLQAFPRWSYPYLGWLLVLLISAIGLPGPGNPYPARVWGLFALTLLLAVLLRPSWEPFKALLRGWRADWTQASFALFAILEFLVWAGFDEVPAPRQILVFWQALAMGMVVFGALGYMRASGKVARMAVLLVGALLSFAIMQAVNGYYWGGPPLLGWLLAVIIYLLSPALLALILDRLTPLRSL